MCYKMKGSYLERLLGYCTMKKIDSYEYFIPQHSRRCTVDAVYKLKCFIDRIAHMPNNGFDYSEVDLGVNLAWRSRQGFAWGALPQNKFSAPRIAAKLWNESKKGRHKMVQIVSINMASRDFISGGRTKELDDFLFVRDVFE